MNLLLKHLSPAWLAFYGSLILSAIAVIGDSVIGKDAAFYMHVAQAYIDGGLAAAITVYNWPWFSILIAIVHSITGVSLEVVGHILCAFFMAGTCAILVRCVADRFPQYAYFACLAVLSVPGFNQFRSDILREFGFWFFSALALWLVLRGKQSNRSGGYFIVSLLIIAAAIFRLEALVLLAGLAVFIVSDKTVVRPWAKLLEVGLIPGLCMLAAVFLINLDYVSSERVSQYLGYLDARKLVSSFYLLADQFAGTLAYKYSKDEAGQVIFFGLLAVLLIKSSKLLGVFLVPLLHLPSLREAAGIYFREYRYFALVGLGYFAVLMIFFIHLQFINSRYVSFIDLLLIPFVAIAAALFYRRFYWLGRGLVVVALIVMMANVISLGAKKDHYVEAGKWVAEHVNADAKVFYDDPRISYYAGRYTRGDRQSTDYSKLFDDMGKYQYYLLELEESPELVRRLAAEGKGILAKFYNERGDVVLAIGDI